MSPASMSQVDSTLASFTPSEIVMLPDEGPNEPASRAQVLRNHLGVAGLTYCSDLLDAEAQRRILEEVDSRPWLNDLRRRVQHYGYRYDYKAREVNPSMYVG